MIYTVIGWHPVVQSTAPADLDWIEDLSKHENCRHYETGLIIIGTSRLRHSKELFRKRVALAKRVNLPIIIHNRESAVV